MHRGDVLQREIEEKQKLRCAPSSFHSSCAETKAAASCCCQEQLRASDEEQQCDRYDVPPRREKKTKLLRVLSVSDDRRVHRSNHNTERPPSTHRPPLPSEWQAEDNNTTVSLHLSPPYLLVFSLPRGLTSSSRLLWCRRQLCWISQDAAVSSSLARVCWCVWEVFVIVVILYLATLWFIKEDQIWKCLCGKAGRV